ncbi:fimbria/pilus outer membrane usher protein, partial [Salmonella enterica subsp. enterica serovar Cerro]|nr:fimbria/pilus outer membrane usher protein [Salmonella enterica subsp. enterica serovar Cerro]
AGYRFSEKNFMSMSDYLDAKTYHHLNAGHEKERYTVTYNQNFLDPELAAASRHIVEEELQQETLSIVGWRDVPTNEGVLGEIALS